MAADYKKVTNFAAMKLISLLMGILLTWHIFVKPIRFRQLLILLVIGYVLIFILKPLFLKLVLKHNGIDPAQMQDRPQH